MPSLWASGSCELINLRFSYTADASIPATAKSELTEFINQTPIIIKHRCIIPLLLLPDKDFLMKF